MPTIKLDKRTIDKVKGRKGVYAKLDRPVVLNTEGQLLSAHKKISEAVNAIVRVAFIEYAKAHGCQPENLDVEWNRFRRILAKYL